MKHYDIFIVGGGMAGIAAAKACLRAGKSVFLCDREPGFGGVLRQCMHRGFGKGLTGPEYTEELLRDMPQGLDSCFSCSVLRITKEKTALVSSAEKGLFELGFSRLILAAGAMEINPGMLCFGGSRPQGLYTAGQAQLINFMGGRFPSPIVILGSGDLGLIMARQLYEQGHEIACIAEKKDSVTALPRNREILDTVPIIFGSSIREIQGERELEGITLEELSSGKTRFIPCRTLLVAAGLRPDRTLVRGLEDEPWITYCGNCLEIYPMVEGLMEAAGKLALAACERIDTK